MNIFQARSITAAALAASIVVAVTGSPASAVSGLDLYFGYGKPNTWGHRGVEPSAPAARRAPLNRSLDSLRSKRFHSFRRIRLERGVYRIVCDRDGRSFNERTSARNGRILSVLPR